MGINAEYVTRGIDLDAFSNISASDKAKLLRLMARVAEKAYRRGAQQGVVYAKLHPKAQPGDVFNWRYGASLDVSPALLHKGSREPSINRLLMEAPGLRHLGFDAPAKRKARSSGELKAGLS